MKSIFACFLMTLHLALFSVSNTFLDYQNYNHGYCPDCNCYPCKCKDGNADDPQDPSTCPKPNPCNPPATSCATECGISIWWIGIGLAGIATAAALIVSSNNGTVHSHTKTP